MVPHLDTWLPLVTGARQAVSIDYLMLTVTGAPAWQDSHMMEHGAERGRSDLSDNSELS